MNKDYMANNKREVTFDMPKTFGNYRVVCRFGYHCIVDYAWWGHLQKEMSHKRWPWSKPRLKWYEVQRCWWSKEITSIEQLKANAISLYYENVELVKNLTKKAMELK